MHTFALREKGYSEDKVAKGGGEDQSGRLSLLALNKVHMPN